MKRIAGLALTGVLLAGCGSSGGGASPTFTESEDCDAEDFRNKETDCGFTQSQEDAEKKKKKKSSSLLKSKSKPFSQGSARR